MRVVMFRLLSGVACLAVSASLAMAQARTESKTSTPGAPSERTQTLNGTVVQVEGNTLVVRMASGDIRMFTPPADRRFVVDGKELALGQLQPGTTLQATVREITTPVVDRTVETLTGKVWYVAAPSVILTLANGENRMYTIPANSPIRFRDSEGKEMTVFELRKDMSVRATRVTEAPRTELVTTVAVTGSAPRGSAGAGTSARSSTAGTGAGASPAPSSGPPRQLPKTASPLPMIGMTGLVSLAAALGLATWRRRRAL